MPTDVAEDAFILSGIFPVAKKSCCKRLIKENALNVAC